MAAAAAQKHDDIPPPKILCLNLDVSDADSVDAAVSKIDESFNDSLDVLVNNAGYLEKWENTCSRQRPQTTCGRA